MKPTILFLTFLISAITVKAQMPSIKSDTAYTEMNTTVIVNVSTNDIYYPSFSHLCLYPYINSGNSEQGVTPQVLNNDYISYTPPAGFLGIDYFLYAQCRNSDNYELDSARVTVFVGLLTNLKTPFINPNIFNLFPNPVSGNLKIEISLPDKEAVEITLVDVTGKTIKRIANSSYEEGSHSLQINLSEIQSGFYFIRLVTENKTINKKLVKY